MLKVFFTSSFLRSENGPLLGSGIQMGKYTEKNTHHGNCREFICWWYCSFDKREWTSFLLAVFVQDFQKCAYCNERSWFTFYVWRWNEEHITKYSLQLLPAVFTETINSIKVAVNHNCFLIITTYAISWHAVISIRALFNHKDSKWKTICENLRSNSCQEESISILTN